MPAIKKFESLDNGDSIYSASRKVSKTQIKNMTPPQPLNYDVSQSPATSQLGLSPSNISNIPQGSAFATAKRGQSLRGYSNDREDLVPKLILNLNNINGLFTSLYLVGDDFHALDMFEDEQDEFGRLEGKGFSGGMETPKRKPGPRKKNTHEKVIGIRGFKK